MKVHWYCGCYVSPHDYGREAEECGAEFDTEEDEQDWLDEACNVTCPGCKVKLTQIYDAVEVQDVQSGD